MPVLSSANAPLLAQNILDSRAVDVLECSIFLPKLQNDPLETTKSGEKKWGIQVVGSGRKKDQRTANGLFYARLPTGSDASLNFSWCQLLIQS